MAVNIAKERWTGKINQLTIGADLKVGGETTLPYLSFEGDMPNKSVVALEVFDTEPQDWPEVLTSAFEGVLNDPVAWAKKCVEYGADAVALKLMSAHPDWDNASGEDVAKTAKAVADAIDVPLIIIGCGSEEKDGEVLPVVAQALEGKNCLIGCVTPDNYKPITAAAIGAGHSLIASSPLDINLAKQLNILLTEMNMPLDKIVIDPLVGALGYGIEYAYSIMERARMGALTGDKMLAMPICSFVGQEVWKAKEAKDPEAPEWGEQKDRAILWEAMTASTFAVAGGNLMIMRHPEAMKVYKAWEEDMLKDNSY